MNINIEDRKQQAETHIFKAIFPNPTNHYDTLFGGTALSWMDEVAFITATRFTRLRVVTVSSDKVDFTHPIPAGTIVELVGKVTETGRTSLKVEVEIFVEEMFCEERQKAVSGSFSFVALDDFHKPVGIFSGVNSDKTQCGNELEWREGLFPGIA